MISKFRNSVLARKRSMDSSTMSIREGSTVSSDVLGGGAGPRTLDLNGSSDMDAISRTFGTSLYDEWYDGIVVVVSTRAGGP